MLWGDYLLVDNTILQVVEAYDPVPSLCGSHWKCGHIKIIKEYRLPDQMLDVLKDHPSPNIIHYACISEYISNNERRNYFQLLINHYPILDVGYWVYKAGLDWGDITRGQKVAALNKLRGVPLYSAINEWVGLTISQRLLHIDNVTNHDLGSIGVDKLQNFGWVLTMIEKDEVMSALKNRMVTGGASTDDERKDDVLQSLVGLELYIACNTWRHLPYNEYFKAFERLDGNLLVKAGAAWSNRNIPCSAYKSALKRLHDKDLFNAAILWVWLDDDDRDYIYNKLVGGV